MGEINPQGHQLPAPDQHLRVGENIPVQGLAGTAPVSIKVENDWSALFGGLSVSHRSSSLSYEFHRVVKGQPEVLPDARPLIIFVKLLYFVQHLVQILNHPHVGHQHLLVLGNQNHIGCRGVPDEMPNLHPLVREDGKGDTKEVLICFNLIRIVPHRDAHHFDIGVKRGVIMNDIVKPINYRRGLVAHGSKRTHKLYQYHLAGDF